MDTVLCEDVTVTMGRLRARVTLSHFPGSSQDELGTSGPRSSGRDREAAQSAAGTPEETLGLGGDCL